MPGSSEVSKQADSSRKKPVKDLESLTQINLNAAGLDIGASEIYACVPSGRDEQSVRAFATFTVDLLSVGRLAEAVRSHHGSNGINWSVLDSDFPDSRAARL